MSDVNNDSVVGKGKEKYLPSSSFSSRNNYDEMVMMVIMVMVLIMVIVMVF